MTNDASHSTTTREIGTGSREEEGASFIRRACVTILRAVRSRWAPPLLVFVAAVAPYLGVLDAPFVFDDTKLVRDNELLRVEGKEAVARFVAAFDTASDRFADEEVRENYRPLRFLSYWVDYQLSKAILDPFDPADPPAFFFHLQNIFWHALNALLVFGIGKALFRSKGAALALALFFALHPLQTEAVTYVSGRRDVLATFFFLAALGLYVRVPPERPLGVLAFFGAPILFALGLFAKEMVITLPAIIFALDLARRPRLGMARIGCHVLLWAVALKFMSETLSNSDLIASPVGGSMLSTILTAPRYIARYFGLVLLPVKQSIDYSYDAIPPSESLFSPATTLAAIAFVVLLSAIAVWGVLSGRDRMERTGRTGSIACWGLVWFLVGLTPILQFVPIPERFAERFAYLPMIGVLVAGIAFARPILARLPRFAAPLVVSILSLSAFSAAFARNAEWRSPLALWESATEAQPRAARAWLAYGNELKENGRFKEAEAAYGTALDLYDENPAPGSLARGQALQARMFRGGVRSVIGRREREFLTGAVADLREVLASTDTDGTEIGSSPRYASIRHELASVLVALGRRDEAKAEFEKLVALGEPRALVADASYWLGKIALLENDMERGVKWFRRALAEIPPGDRTLFNVSLELADLLSDLAEDHERAWKILEHLLAQEPDRDTQVGIYLRMAKILDRQGEVEACIRKLEEALSINPRAVPVLLTLAGIEANLGRDDRAVDHYRLVLEVEPRNREAREGLKGIAVRRGVEEKKSEDEKNEEVLRGLYNRGRRHREAGEWLASRDVFLQLLRAATHLGNDEGIALACCEIADVEETLGRPDVAERYLAEAERVLPARAETLLQAAAFHMRNDSDAAVVRGYCLRYIDAVPEGESPKPEVFLYLADLATESDPRAALGYLERARELGAEARLGAEAVLLDSRIGYLHARLGEWQKSYDALQRYLDQTRGEDSPDRRRAVTFMRERVVPALLEESSKALEGGERNG